MIVGTDAGKPRLIDSMQTLRRSADTFYYQELDYAALSAMLMACSCLKKLGTRRERSFKVPQMYVPPMTFHSIFDALIEKGGLSFI